MVKKSMVWKSEQSRIGNLTSLSFLVLRYPLGRRMSTVATLSLLRLPILSQKQHHSYSNPRSKLPVIASDTKLNIPNDSTYPPTLFNDTIHHLKSATLPLTAVALPFFLDTKASTNDNFGLNILPPFFLESSGLELFTLCLFVRMHLLWVGSLGFWKVGLLHSYTHLLWVVCSSILSGQGIWVGNGGGFGLFRMRLMSSRSK